MQGKIIKGIAGFYYVNIDTLGVFECKAKGAFRNEGIKPLVGDDVEIDIIDEERKLGNVTTILPRKTQMIRPASANVDQAIVIFSVKSPDPNFNLLDRFLIYMESEHVPVIICFNKEDLLDGSEMKGIKKAYEGAGYTVLFVSARNNDGIDKIRALMDGKTTVVAGPSGVGKSTITNLLCNNEHMETGSISRKTERGRHTTRHAELMPVSEGTYIMDTPGFTSLEVFGADADTLKYFYGEFEQYNGSCRFRDCMHINEPDCEVKAAVAVGKISKIRYENYTQLYNETKRKNAGY